MTDWIFQANPDSFDLDGFLATKPATMLYLANQHRASMAVGDTVFLWRAIGSGASALSGVVAETTIIEQPMLQNEDATALTFWKDPNLSAPAERVRLRLDRIELRDRVKRDWLKDDPICRDMRIFRMAAETNYRLTSEEGRRLMNVWRRANAPWNYADTIAGLWAFSETRGGKVSVLPGSPVAIAALRTGRVVRKGMANKVSNFVALDPRDPRSGFSNANSMDRMVWDRFFDANTNSLDCAAIQAEFDRLWPSDGLPDVMPPSEPTEASADIQNASLKELLSRWSSKLKQTGGLDGRGTPKVVRAITSSFVRDPLIVAIAQRRAASECEVPNCTHPLFKDTNGNVFLEVHHIVPLRDGGTDRPENVAAICPAHHREAHHGKQAAAIAEALKDLRGKDAIEL